MLPLSPTTFDISGVYAGTVKRKGSYMKVRCNWRTIKIEAW